MSLTDRAIVNLKATGKQHKHFDGGGLYLMVSPAGGKLWRLFYRINGKEKLLSFGKYPAISLKKARQLRDEARELIAQGGDPAERKKEAKAAEQELVLNTFENIAREWHDKFKERWTEKNAKVILARMQRDIFPHIGATPIRDLKAPDLLAVARRIEARGALDYAHRALQYCGMVFRYAISTGRAEHNIVADLRGALPPAKVTHHATIIDPKEIGKLLRALDTYDGHFVVGCALKLAPLVFVRPGELRYAQWPEFNFDKAEWRIPAERMKMKEQHIVPLARQTLEILRALYTINGHGQFLFPSIRTVSRPMSDNTVNAALRRLGYAKEEMTGHGFRSMASTLLNELGWNRDAIERQLAHGERNAVRAAYNFAEFLPERRKMMQAWADYLDDLRRGDNQLQ
jgi:integrase